MKLNFSIDTEDLYGEGSSFEDILTDSLRREIIQSSKDQIASEKFHEFSKLVSDTLISEIKLRLQNFLSEEISLTESWGEKTFVGSIEDLIKQRFDDVLLRPVDSYGKTVQGCTSSGKTWIEWRIENELGDSLTKHIESVQRKLQKFISDTVSKKLIEIKNEGIKSQVDEAFASILKKL